MERARDTGLPAATGTGHVVARESGARQAAGFLIYAPIYENDRTPNNCQTNAGTHCPVLSTASFAPPTFSTAVLAIKNTSDIDFQLYDGPEPRRET